MTHFKLKRNYQIFLRVCHPALQSRDLTLQNFLRCPALLGATEFIQLGEKSFLHTIEPVHLLLFKSLRPASSTLPSRYHSTLVDDSSIQGDSLYLLITPITDFLGDVHSVT